MCYVDVFSVCIHTRRVTSDKSLAIQKQIGKRIKDLRTAKGVSQEAFADNCGLHRTHMSLLERGRVNFTIRTLVQITEALEIELHEFFSGVRRR
jgi:transcriptional regulator with XRE-family HTH domain